jgi:hypothetical protein
VKKSLRGCSFADWSGCSEDSRISSVSQIVRVDEELEVSARTVPVETRVMENAGDGADRRRY